MEPPTSSSTRRDAQHRFYRTIRRTIRRAIRQVAIGLLVCISLACSTASKPGNLPRHPPEASSTQPAPGEITKRISFSLLEDYDKGEPLDDIARDFELMNELGIDTWRGSFGWDDYEPARGQYDFDWLHRFADLAAKYRIRLRPYLGYTPEWAAQGGSDDAAWNDPPKNLDDWSRFVYTLASAMKRHTNLLSYEIYNEENVRQWWDGTVAEYNQLLLRGAAAIRLANPAAQVLLGGLVYPDVEWIEALCITHANAGSFAVAPLHAYPETWTPPEVVVENYLDAQYELFVRAIDRDCRRKPIWINEAGYATTPGKSEQDQANWWARAVATFIAAPRVEQLGIFRIKDLRPESPVIGGGENHFLGITRVDRTKKLAFYTLKRLIGWLSRDPVTVADPEVTVEITAGKTEAFYHHLFVRPNGGQLLFVWDKRGSPTVNLRVARQGSAAREYALDGTPSSYPAFDGWTLRNIQLTPGNVRIFEIPP
ncbi:MAG: beta-galactosidase [Nitrospirae bacterium]|nr:beta-galactosidase [Candidatus Manganitrophaceae bacterium]